MKFTYIKMQITEQTDKLVFVVDFIARLKNIKL